MTKDQYYLDAAIKLLNLADPLTVEDYEKAELVVKGLKLAETLPRYRSGEGPLEKAHRAYERILSTQALNAKLKALGISFNSRK